MNSSRTVRFFGRRFAATALLAGAVAGFTSPARAIQFEQGDLKGSFDTTLSFGGLYGLQNPDPNYYGTTNLFNGTPGRQNSVNTDDGNLNYGKGWASELLKGSHELELKYHDFGALVRGYWFTDFKTNDTLRTPLSDQAKDRVVRGGEWLDMYARAGFTAAHDIPVDVRIGRQVLSLGESTFIPNGINVINPVNLANLRAPGAELKEALLPVNMVNVSVGVTPNITIQPFWLLEFRRNELEPAGTYFSTNDFATRGGDTVWLGFGSIPDHGSTLGGITREHDRDGRNFNQGGVAMRILAPGLHDTEFGFYYAKYNSRSPVISARTPTSPIDAVLVQTTAGNLATQNLAPALIAAGLPPPLVPGAIQTLLGYAFATPAGVTPSMPGIVTPGGTFPLQPFYPAASQIAAGAGKIGLLTAAATGRYFDEYPNGIDMLGASFNTALGNTGISWQGEVSYKSKVPLQVDDVELLFAALSSLTPQFQNQLGNYFGRYNTEIPGYRRHDVWTAQTTLTKVFGPTLGAQQLTLLGEVGGVYVNLPAKSQLRYDAPGTFTAGNQDEMNSAGFPQFSATSSNAFADKFSWGYQLLGRLEYNNLLPNITVLPTVAFTHDVSGNTPLPLANFVRDRKSVTVAVEFIYRNAWSLELRYVNFFGAGRYNLLADRDYFASTVKYSF